ncbi:MAG: trypsin-like peptidase domain-containing protein [Candidatus Pacebacteria bacterium]|nr:trypsin-like peptidase domain-containing protein [Candidatus Paceibacterota bacterium]
MQTNAHPALVGRIGLGTILTIVVLTTITTLLVLWFIVTKLPAEYLPQSLTTREEVQNIPLVTRDLVSDTIPDMVERVSPAVVSVVISADVPIIEQYYESYSPFDFFFGQGFGGFNVPRQRQIGTEKREIGGGSGFFVSPEGFIVTNRHVVDLDDVEYSVVTNDGTSYEAVVVAKDPSLDIAILKVEGAEAFPFLEFGDTEQVRRGETVVAIGNALAEFPNSVSVGVVSGLSRDIVAGDGRGFMESLEGVIQTDAAINQGNSGGPLLNTAGEVIGVNVAVVGGSENIGFALPSDSVQNVYESVKEYGEISMSALTRTLLGGDLRMLSSVTECV